MDIKAFIFDLDGVIVHTDKYHYKAWKMLADKLGIYFDEKINNRLRGISRMDSLEIILENYKGSLTHEQKVSLAEEKNKNYRKLLEGMSSNDLSSDVYDTLKTLKAKGYKLAIGSSSKNARFILEKIGLKDFFDAVSDGNNITKSKPDPQVFLMAAQYIKIEPCKCIVVEDAFSGIEAAVSGGFIPAAIGEAIKNTKAVYKLEKFSDLIQNFNK